MAPMRGYLAFIHDLPYVFEKKIGPKALAAIIMFGLVGDTDKARIGDLVLPGMNETTCQEFVDA